MGVWELMGVEEDVWVGFRWIERGSVDILCFNGCINDSVRIVSVSFIRVSAMLWNQRFEQF